MIELTKWQKFARVTREEAEYLALHKIDTDVRLVTWVETWSAMGVKWLVLTHEGRLRVDRFKRSRNSGCRVAQHEARRLPMITDETKILEMLFSEPDGPYTEKAWGCRNEEKLADRLHGALVRARFLGFPAN